MSFTPAQQGIYRPLVDQAWKQHCTANAKPQKDKAAKEEWYRQELVKCLGKPSTKSANKSTDFEKAMAHFEAICGDSIEWGMRYYKGASRRIIHSLNEITVKHGIDEDYCRRVARQALQALQADHLPELIDLNPELLLTILNSLRIYVRRHKPHSQTTPDENPF